MSLFSAKTKLNLTHSRILYGSIATAVAVFFVFSFIQSSAAAPKSDSGRYIVVYKDSVNMHANERAQLVNSVGTRASKGFSNTIKGDVVTVNSKRDLARLKADPRVAYVEKDGLVHFAGIQTSGAAKHNAPAVWSDGFTGDGIKVAVLDSGIDTSHPDLQPVIAGGYDVVADENDFEDEAPVRHGTRVSGVIAAAANSQYVKGIAYDVDLYPVVVIATSTGYVSDVIEGIDWAVDNNMDVVNMSITIEHSNALEDAVEDAADAGVVMVAAAGNESGAVQYPAKFPDVIAVSSVNGQNQFSGFSNYGSEIDFTGLGERVLTTVPAPLYMKASDHSGTSFSAPAVTGVIALLLGDTSQCDTNSDSACDVDEVRTRLANTAIDLGASGKDNYFGWGIPDAEAALGL